MTMIEFILKTRIKYVAVGLICLFFVILFLTSAGDNSEDELVLDQINQKIISVRGKEIPRSYNLAKKTLAGKDIVDFGVQFYSGKEAVQEVENEKKPFQIHKIQLVNRERVKADLKCQDAFSTFGRLLPPGGMYKFSVTDLFAKRHYWCHVRYGTSEYTFRAYGEGAPRDNNIVNLHKDGAYINGVNYRIGAYNLDEEEPDEHQNKNDPNTVVEEVKAKTA
ncbi:hypothetical protein Ocin01_12710 [Orchesella cincta]|uniref:Uncharacterized protein n=1 Tax=Orchesella cincta TaxID=48709 RepID=A0A1D2MM60_ORCCI|nr:hypothetical protein Ocin01_12710 [Orchesella cincta]